MRFEHDFTLRLSKAEAWNVLTDVPRIAPCMPGATLECVEGDTYKGAVSVKVGPIATKYRGQAAMVERDDAAYRIVLDGKGAESTGSGGATAHMVGTLHDAGDGRTQVMLTTDMQLSGKIAQLGQGMIKDVSARLLAQFVKNLEAKLAAEGAQAPAPTVAPAPGAAATPIQSSALAEPIDVGALGAAAMWDRYGLKIGLAIIILLQLVIIVRQ